LVKLIYQSIVKVRKRNPKRQKYGVASPELQKKLHDMHEEFQRRSSRRVSLQRDARVVTGWERKRGVK